MAVPSPNPTLDANGLTVTRFYVKEDPVFADTDNRPLSDLNQRDVDLYNFVNSIRSFCRASARSTPNNTVLLSGGYITWKGGRSRTTIANDFASSITFDVVTAAGQKRIDLLGINTAVTPVVPLKITGVENATTPVEPAYPEWFLPLAAIYVDEPTTVIVNTADITDIRPILQVPGSTLPCGSVIDVMYQPGVEVQLNGFLPAIGTYTIGNAGSGATFAGAIYEPLYNRIKNSVPNAGTEVFSAGTPVVIPDWTQRIPIGLDSTDTDINAIGKVAGDFAHSHTVTAHTHVINNQAAVNITSSLQTASGAFNLASGGGVIYDHTHTTLVPQHNHGGLTGSETPTTTTVTQKPKVRTVYKIVKF